MGLYYELRLSLPSNYPFSPPRLEFVTPVFHYAVSTEGRVCLPVLQEDWAPSKGLVDVLEDLQDLIHNHTKVDPHANLSLRSWLSDLLRTEPAEYRAQADAHVRANAVRCGA